MSQKTIGLYFAKSGKEAVRLKEYPLRDGALGYSWIGEYGAGSGEALGVYLAMIARFQKTKRGMQTAIDAHNHAHAYAAWAVRSAVQGACAHG